MSSIPQPRSHPFGAAVPAPHFSVTGAHSEDHAAVPTLSFSVQIRAPGQHIQAILLDVQLQIAARRRGYDDDSQNRLQELFGRPAGWRSTLRTLPWLRTTVVVPQFQEETVVALPVHCSYDLEVTAAKYFAALEDGEVPLEFLFSGSLFFSTPEGGLQTSRISWDSEAEYRLPVALWRAAIDRHFPGSAWLRLPRRSFDRLWRYRATQTFTGWEAAIDALLEQAGQP